MNITFINPATALRRNPLYRWGGKVYGHSNSITGPLILGGILKRAGHHVEAYEELNGSVPMKKVLQSTDVLCLYTMTSTAPRAYELADLFHEQGHARVLIGGIHASALSEEALEHADQVITGEGENVILDVVEGRLTDPIVHCDPICDLDSVPYPDYSILKTPCDAANVISTRGCTYCCTFCTTSRMFAPYRQRSVDNVIDEIHMYKDMGFKFMNFEDDNFTADKERAKEICRRMIAEGLTFKETFFFGRTDMAKDEELLDLLQKAHLNRVLIGIESLKQSALDAIHKGQNIQDIENAAAACKRHGIRVIASIVLGLDEEDKEDIRRSVAFARSIDAYQLQPAILTPYPGTPVYEQFKREGRLLDLSWKQYDMLDVVFQPRNMSPWDLQDEFYRADNEFYNFKQSFTIGKLFGAEYGWRFFGLAFFAHIAPWAARVASNHAKSTDYFKLRHTPWMYADTQEQPAAEADGAEGGRETRKGRRDPQKLDTSQRRSRRHRAA